MIETNRDDLRQVWENVGINGSICYEFDTFITIWDSFMTRVDIFETIWGTSN